MTLERSVVSAALTAVMLALAPAAEAQPTTLRMRGVFVAEHTSSRAMESFKAEAERRSGGSIEIELIPDTLGGGSREILDDVRTEKFFGTWIGSSNIARLVPEIGAMSLPFVFENWDQVARALKGPVGTLLEAKLASKGYTALGWMQFGARQVTNSRKPLRTLDDFKGLKIRLQPNEMHLAIFRALGANAIAMDLKDLYVALRQGDIDAQENPYAIIYDYKWYEHQKYLSDTAHVLDLIAIVANRNAFMRLQPHEQKAILEAAAIASAQQWKTAAAEDADALVKLKTEIGMQFDPLPPATRVALRKATAVVIDDAMKRVGDELVNEILAVKKVSAGKGDRR
jgi:tripartite ATP-independent transporter DctP family solute receptor